MSDDELIEAMHEAMYDDGCPGAVDSMHAVLAVVRAHDSASPTALANSGPKERQEAFDALKEELDDALAELAALRAHDGAALAQLGRWCLTESRGNDCSDIDGGSLQEKAIELGLLAYVTVTEPCGEGCACMDYYAGDEWPHECLRETSAAMRAEG